MLDRIYTQTTAAKNGIDVVEITESEVSAIGTVLAAIIKRETGEDLACDACRREVLRLNTMSPEKVRQGQGPIVDGIVARGRKLLGWWSPKRWAVGLAPGLVKHMVRQWVEEAIEKGGDATQELDLDVSFVPEPAWHHESGDSVSRGRLLPEEDQDVARGLLTGMPRAEVLARRKRWKQQGFELPPLEFSRGRRRQTTGGGQSMGWMNPNHWANSFHHTCVHLGKRKGALGCSCGGSQKVVAYQCNHRQGPSYCCLTDDEHKKIRDMRERRAVNSCESCRLYNALPRFVSNSQYAQDVQRLVPLVPSDVTTIAGVARSGLAAATMLSMLLHLPLEIVRQEQGDVVHGGNGWRLLQGRPQQNGAVLVVDDTCMTGNSLKAIKPIVGRYFGDRKTFYASVYVNPLSNAKPDLWAVDLPWPHLLEWNLFNSVLLPSCVFDFDGILCHDCPPGDDDDGTRYLRFLENTLPFYPVRKQAIPLIVTARLEKYRKQTTQWLTKWGIKADRLVMGPWATIHERHRSDVAAYKAEHYSQFMRRRVHPGPHLFIESDRHTAERIAHLSGGIVVCPAAGRCFGR